MFLKYKTYKHIINMTHLFVLSNQRGLKRSAGHPSWRTKERSGRRRGQVLKEEYRKKTQGCEKEAENLPKKLTHKNPQDMLYSAHVANTI